MLSVYLSNKLTNVFVISRFSSRYFRSRNSPRDNWSKRTGFWVHHVHWLVIDLSTIVILPNRFGLRHSLSTKYKIPFSQHYSFFTLFGYTKKRNPIEETFWSYSTLLISMIILVKIPVTHTPTILLIKYTTEVYQQRHQLEKYSVI